MEKRITNEITGGQKGQKDERFSLIPKGALAEIARVYGFGAEKYSPNNWRKGYAWSLSLDALYRHIVAFETGEDIDPESGLHHLAHAGFHILALLTYVQEGQYLLDDRWAGYDKELAAERSAELDQIVSKYE